MNSENTEFGPSTFIRKLKNLSTTLNGFDKSQIGLPHLPEEDVSMLSIVVEDAEQGVDIFKKYPKFIQSVLDSSLLYEDFIDMVEIVENVETLKRD